MNQPKTLAAVTLCLAALALLTPLGGAESPGARIGWLLLIAAGIEMLHSLRRATAKARRQATASAVFSFLIAIPLINSALVELRALRLLVAVLFGIDACRYAIAAARQEDRRNRLLAMAGAIGNAAVLLLIAAPIERETTWVIAIAGALRIAGIAWNIITAPVYGTSDADQTVVGELGLTGQPDAVAMAADVERAETARTSIDRGWTIAFILTLFAIHQGRMTTERTLLSMASPAVAVLGDMCIAMLFSLLVISPAYVLFRGPSRWIERHLWVWYLARRSDASRWIMQPLAWYLRWSLALAIRMRGARYSLPTALNQALQRGLPAAAIMAAVVPIAGMSWYFDTENWAAGMWNSWAASRTDGWREAMVDAVLASPDGAARATPFGVEPPGIASGDFSFIVIGDTGEGDASQHVLRDQLLSVANQSDVRFVVISSDVVYPTGAMKDYEAKFWLPFKGVSKPVYAIPGNHDWYDALEAFSATFLEPNAAKTVIRARVEADLRVTSTTDRRIDDILEQTARLRDFYRVPTGFQRAPFFEIQTDRFALLAIDTGVLRTIDPAEERWLDGALQRSAGKFTLAVVGHPFYAGGADVTEGDEPFSRLKSRLIEHGVTTLMAGDTHDLEYYAAPGPSQGTTVRQFVNGGGGAYLSFGTALAWPAQAPTRDWAYYPDNRAVTQKIEQFTPVWKRPAWFWTREFGAWPFSAEWLSAVFDYNVAPFFQSFVEVRVERSANRVLVIPYGVHGRLTWGEIAASPSVRPPGAADASPIEWIVPMQ